MPHRKLDIHGEMASVSGDSCQFTRLLFLLFLASTTCSGCHSSRLTYGHLTPEPLSAHEEVIQKGRFVGQIERLGGGINETFKGKVRFRNSTVHVVIKPTTLLSNDGLKDGILPYSDNKNADAAYHVNRFLDIVNTPPHVIRDDAPIDLDRSTTGPAGVQLFWRSLEPPKPDILDEIIDTESGRREIEGMAVFDIVIGNKDRHLGNYGILRNDNGLSLVAIDHSTAFPNIVEDDGMYQMIHLHELATGESISAHIIEKLKSFRSKRRAVDRVLRLNIDCAAIELMWWRVDRLIEEGKVFYP